MALIKTLNLGQAEVEIYDDYIPTDIQKKKENLIKVYDVINDIATKLERKKIKSWFLTNEQIKTMKESGKYNFI